MKFLILLLFVSFNAQAGIVFDDECVALKEKNNEELDMEVREVAARQKLKRCQEKWDTLTNDEKIACIKPLIFMFRR